MGWLCRLRSRLSRTRQPSSASPPPPSTPLEPASESAAAPTSTQATAEDVDVHQGVKTITVAVLLDGDGDVFTPVYMNGGVIGGSCAALDMRNQLRTFFARREREKTPGLGLDGEIDVQLLVQSFMNMTSLASNRQAALKAFARGFSSQGAFSMIDAGNADQAADVLIHAHLKFHVKTCDYVVIGGSHDGGYAAVVEELDEASRQKLLLLRTQSYCARRILDLGLEQFTLNGLFAGNKTQYHPSAATASDGIPAAQSTSSSPSGAAQVAGQSVPRSTYLAITPSSSPPTTPPLPVAATPRTVRRTPPPQFAPLVRVLQAAKTDQPRWDVVCEMLNRGGSRPYPGRYKTYIAAAEQAGVVQISGKQGTKRTIQLTAHYR